MANEENLIPIKTLSKEEAKKRGSAGGIKSGESRREKKRFAEMYSKVLEKKYKAETDKGEKVEASGYDLLEAAILKILCRGDSASVSLIKELREGIDGTMIELSGKDGGPIEIIDMLNEYRQKRDS